MFEGVVGSGYQGDVSIDDVSISDQSCNSPGTCYSGSILKIADFSSIYISHYDKILCLATLIIEVREHNFKLKWRRLSPCVDAPV